MRKLTIFILALFYITTTTGATMHLHYCMGRLVNWGLWQKDSGVCGKCGMEKNSSEENGCCKDEQKQVKLDNDHNASAGYKHLQTTPIATGHNFPEASLSVNDNISKKIPLSHAPLRCCSIADYILYCIFRI